MGHIIRHTLELQSRPTKLRRTRAIVAYSTDMYGRPIGVNADATAGIWSNDPYWSFADGADQGIAAMLKLPEDRVMGTDVKVYLEFGIPTGPGGGTIMWELDWLVRGLGNLYWVLPTVRMLPTLTLSTFRITTTQKLIIPAFVVDYQHNLGQPVEFFFGIIRRGTNPEDTDASAAHLHKLILEYVSDY